MIWFWPTENHVVCWPTFALVVAQFAVINRQRFLLAHLGEDAGLLRLSSFHRPKGSLMKFFNCYKNVSTERHIGYRRGQNSYVCRVSGPSRFLPSGSDMMDLQIDVKRLKVVVIITDGKDYYHRIWSSAARATTNAVGPPVLVDLFRTQGLIQLL